MALRKIYTITEIVNRMITRMSTSTGITDFTPGSNIRTIFETVAIFVEYLQFIVEEAYRSFYIDTANGLDLESRAADFGMNRKPARYSSGTVKFMRMQYSPDVFYIYAGAQVSTQPDVFGNTVSFRLMNDIVFPSSTPSSPVTFVTGKVICETAGPIGNVAQGKVTNITSIIPGIDSVTNLEAFSDGANEETDDQLRKRIPVFLNGIKKATEDAIKSAALSVPGISYVKLKENSPSDGMNTIYVSSDSINGGLSEQQKIEVEDAVESAIAFGIKFQILEPAKKNIKLKLKAEIDNDNYDKALLAESIKKAITEYVNTSTKSELQVYDIILAANVPGVNNVKDVSIAEGDSTTFLFGDYKPTGSNDAYVIRLEIDQNTQYANSSIQIEFFDMNNDSTSLGVF